LQRLFELFLWVSGCGGKAAAARNPQNSECGKREIAPKIVNGEKAIISLSTFPV
jgi:hypothetical protein